MSVTVTRTATATTCSERWTNFNASFLQYWDSYLAILRLQANDSEKWGYASGYGFSIPADATITNISTAAFWWGSHAGSYVWLEQNGVRVAYDTGAVSGRWMTGGMPLAGVTPAMVNQPAWSSMVYIGRTTGAAVNVNIDQITCSITYEPAYVAPPAPPPPPEAPDQTTVPILSTQACDYAWSTRLRCNGTIVSDGGRAIQDHGFCVHQWPASQQGTVGVAGGAVGAFSLIMERLFPSTSYYIRAYAGNVNGYGFSPWEAVASTEAQKAGNGGTGLVSSISGQSTGYAGGGGGGMYSTGTPGGAGYGGGGGISGGGWGGFGIINTGGGGGGAGEGGWGGAGGRGVVVIRYKTANAVSTSPSLSTSIFRPSIAYRGGKLFAPYSRGEDAKILTITGNTLANPTIVTTSAAHGILAATAQVVVITGSNSNPTINGSYVATRIDDTHFSIPVNVTTAGTAGLLLYNHSVGWALTAGGCNNVGWLTQSPTTFHTGTMKKDYRYASVSHDLLPDGATIRPLSWLIDGEYGTADGVAFSPHETRFPINQQGYSIQTTMGMTPDYTHSVSPVTRGTVVIWDFVKTPKHTYNLDCRTGAGNGSWRENPEEAIAALFQAADTRSTFEDRYNGVYTGIMDGIEFKQAARSLKEGPSGLVKITVREVE